MCVWHVEALQAVQQCRLSKPRKEGAADEVRGVMGSQSMKVLVVFFFLFALGIIIFILKSKRNLN